MSLLGSIRLISFKPKSSLYNEHVAIATSRGFTAELGRRKAPRSCDWSTWFFYGIIPLDNPRLRKQFIYSCFDNFSNALVYNFCSKLQPFVA